MTTLKSAISWCDGTLNLAVGCHKVSPGCRNCYAEKQVTRLTNKFGHPFDEIKKHPHRLNDIRKFKARRTPDGLLEPAMIFVNSMSDMFHEELDFDFIDRAFDAFEFHDDKIFQILTKRPARMRDYMRRRFKNRAVPDNLWVGPSIESNQLGGRARIVRRLKEDIGDFTAFASVEPIVGPTDKLDLSGFDWVLLGGESGPGARIMDEAWLRDALAEARRVAAAVHMKQWGSYRSSPLVRRIMRDCSLGPKRAFEEACARSLELAPEEKGGATVDGRLIREKPPAFYRIKERLNRQQTLV